MQTLEEFGRFWAAYPKRVARLAALKAWKHLNPTPEQVDEMITALRWQVQQPAWRKDGGQFIPYPASWIRAGRWEDEPDHQPVREEWVCRHTPPCLGRHACHVLTVCGR